MRIYIGMVKNKFNNNVGNKMLVMLIKIGTGMSIKIIVANSITNLMIVPAIEAENSARIGDCQNTLLVNFAIIAMEK